MLSSMTGFSRVVLPTELASGSIELRSINHKQLDINLRINELGKCFEEKARNILKECFSRGRIDCTINIDLPVETTDLVLNSKILENLAQVKLEIEDLTSIKINSSLLEILRWPGVCQHKDIDETQIIKILNDPFMDAVEQLKASRHSEGKELTKVIERKLASYTSNFLQIGENQSEINKELVKKFKDRILELTQSPDNARLEQECAILIQKMDITEEIDRIRYHLTSLETILKKGGVAGRKIGFILQEISRETNTLGAKTNQISVTETIIEMKIYLEQIREQIQNVE